MWTELFQPAAACAPEPGGKHVDCVAGPAQPVSAPGSANTGIHPGIVAKSVDGVDDVDLCKADIIDTSLPVSTWMTASTATSVLPTSLNGPTGLASIASTRSTPSTPGKHCRLLTAAEKYELIELFRLDLIPLDMPVSSVGLFTADELRRTNNVAWRLVTVEGMTFEAAMQAAARWVAANPPHPDEQTFVDVLTLYRKVAT